VLILLKLVVLLAATSLAASTPAGRSETPKRIEITAARFAYNPAAITLKRGEPVVLVLHSTDVTHGIKIDELNIKSEEIKKGKETLIQFTPEKAGHYIGKCAHFCGKGHGSMTLQIDVLP
jgi:cytochrome c oxidase subunit 2